MSRESILAQLRANKPAESVSLPTVPDFAEPTTDLVAQFQLVLESSKAAVHRLSADEDLNQFIQTKFPEAKAVLSEIAEVKSTISYDMMKTAIDFANLEVVVLKGELGVADTGAIWISDGGLRARVLPFITQQLVIVIESRSLVPKMHQAYRRIRPDGLSFGVFISGPSKTADIEQALVVGAHGALGLTVIIIN